MRHENVCFDLIWSISFSCKWSSKELHKLTPLEVQNFVGDINPLTRTTKNIRQQVKAHLRTFILKKLKGHLNNISVSGSGNQPPTDPEIVFAGLKDLMLTAERVNGILLFQKRNANSVNRRPLIKGFYLNNYNQRLNRRGWESCRGSAVGLCGWDPSRLVFGGSLAVC